MDDINNMDELDVLCEHCVNSTGFPLEARRACEVMVRSNLTVD